jgi:hypothetical protein
MAHDDDFLLKLRELNEIYQSICAAQTVSGNVIKKFIKNNLVDSDLILDSIEIYIRVDHPNCEFKYVGPFKFLVTCPGLNVTEIIELCDKQFDVSYTESNHNYTFTLLHRKPKLI